MGGGVEEVLGKDRKVREGNENYKRNNFEEAEKDYKKAIKYNPTMTAHNGMATTAYRLGKYQKAKKHFKIANKMKGKENKAINLIGLAATYRKLKQNEKAIEKYKKVIEIEENNQTAHFQLAYLFEKLNQHQKAIKYYRKVIRMNEAFTEAHYNLAIILFHLRNFKDAKYHIGKVIEIDHPSADYHFTLANIYLEEKKYKKAIEHYNHSIALDKSHLLAHLGLGFTYLMNKRYEEAIDQFFLARGSSPFPSAASSSSCEITRNEANDLALLFSAFAFIKLKQPAPALNLIHPPSLFPTLLSHPSPSASWEGRMREFIRGYVSYKLPSSLSLLSSAIFSLSLSLPHSSLSLSHSSLSLSPSSLSPSSLSPSSLSPSSLSHPLPNPENEVGGEKGKMRMDEREGKREEGWKEENEKREESEEREEREEREGRKEREGGGEGGREGGRGNAPIAFPQLEYRSHYYLAKALLRYHRRRGDLDLKKINKILYHFSQSIREKKEWSKAYYHRALISLAHLPVRDYHQIKSDLLNAVEFNDLNHPLDQLSDRKILSILELVQSLSSISPSVSA